LILKVNTNYFVFKNQLYVNKMHHQTHIVVSTKSITNYMNNSLHTRRTFECTNHHIDCNEADVES